MKEHKENLVKLIKMITTIKENQILHAISNRLDESKADTYIFDGDLLSLRELTRMFIDELNSKYLKCHEDDEIVKFIKDISSWFGRIYDEIIEDKRTNIEDIKTMKICGQLRKDYDKVYSEAQGIKIRGCDNSIVATINNDRFEFGKRNMPKENYTTNNNVQPITINVTFTGDENTNKTSADELVKYLEGYVNKLKNR